MSSSFETNFETPFSFNFTRLGYFVELIFKLKGLKQAWKRAFSGKTAVILLQKSARRQTSDWLFTFGEILTSWQQRSAQSDYKIYSLCLSLEDSFLAKCMVTAWYHSHLISNNNLTVSSSSYSLSICLLHPPSNNKNRVTEHVAVWLYKN